jgi:hypothetical protein
VFDGDEGRLSEEAFLRDFAGDLPEAKAKALYAVQEPFHRECSRRTQHGDPSPATTPFPRKTAPSIRTSRRFMAERMGAKTIEVRASHLSLISHPEEITRLILEAAGQETQSVRPYGGRRAKACVS